MGSNKFNFIMGCVDFALAGGLFTLTVLDVCIPRLFSPVFVPANIIAMAVVIYLGHRRLNRWKDNK